MGEGNREIRSEVEGLGATSGNERRVAFDGADGSRVERGRVTVDQQPQKGAVVGDGMVC